VGSVSHARDMRWESKKSVGGAMRDVSGRAEGWVWGLSTLRNSSDNMLAAMRQSAQIPGTWGQIGGIVSRSSTGCVKSGVELSTR